MRNQSPLHEPALVAATVPDNDGYVRRSLRCDVKARHKGRQVAVEVPANQDVTELERSGEAARRRKNLALSWWSVKTASMQD
jgi:hypothetical protein